MTYEYVRYGGREAICKARSVSEVRKEMDVSKGRSKVVMSLISEAFPELISLLRHFDDPAYILPP